MKTYLLSDITIEDMKNLKGTTVKYSITNDLTSRDTKLTMDDADNSTDVLVIGRLYCYNYYVKDDVHILFLIDEIKGSDAVVIKIIENKEDQAND